MEVAQDGGKEKGTGIEEHSNKAKGVANFRPEPRCLA